MDFNKAALEMHETHHGKVGIVSKVEVKTRDDLSTAYTPGVARTLPQDQRESRRRVQVHLQGQYGGRRLQWHGCAGAGRHRPRGRSAGHGGQGCALQGVRRRGRLPHLHRRPRRGQRHRGLQGHRPHLRRHQPRGHQEPECFEIEETLERELDIPVFHDDQHGTAIVVTAALINALRVVGKKMEDVHIVLNGPGAAGTAIIKMLMTAGAKDIIAVDQFGTLYKAATAPRPTRTGWAK